MAVPGTKITAHKQGLQAGEASHIHAVVVFLDQAQIKRRAEAPVAPGLNRCLLEIEAFDVDERSTEASVRGEGDVVGVMVREVPSQAAPQQMSFLELRACAATLLGPHVIAPRCLLLSHTVRQSWPIVFLAVFVAPAAQLPETLV